MNNTGGPAFPAHTIAMHEGMSLRDWFAGKAMQGMLSDPNFDESPEHTAELCYFLADAMLRAREAA